jgi:hypothetical protein
VKPGQKFSLVDGAIGWRIIGNVDKFDCHAPIKTPHQSDLSLAKGAISIKPNCDRPLHKAQYGGAVVKLKPLSLNRCFAREADELLLIFREVSRLGK